MPIDLAFLDEGAFVRDEFDHLLIFDPQQTHELQSRGIIWRQADGRWRIKSQDRDVLRGRHADLASCDFCGSRPVAWAAHCDSFTDNLDTKWVDQWQCCQRCGGLIEAEDREELLRRTIASVLLRHDDRTVRILIRRQLRHLLTLFWQHYRGHLEPVVVRRFGH